MSGYAGDGDECHGGWISAVVCTLQMTHMQSCSLCPGQEGLPLCSPGKVEVFPTCECFQLKGSLLQCDRHPVPLAHGNLQDGAAPRCPPGGSPTEGTNIVPTQANGKRQL